MKNKLVIFDLDGTLLDTSGDLTDSMNAMLDSFGFPLITREQAKRYIGNGARKFVERSLPEGMKDMTDRALAVYNSVYGSCGSPKTVLYDGMAEVLKDIAKAGALTAVVSNKPQDATDAVCGKYLKNFRFDYIYGNRQGFAHKPQKECGEMILASLGVAAEDAVVVGDGETDAEFASNLGAHFVGVTWGYRTAEVLREHGAKILVSNTAELDTILTEFIHGRII